MDEDICTQSLHKRVKIRKKNCVIKTQNEKKNYSQEKEQEFKFNESLNLNNSKSLAEIKHRIITSKKGVIKKTLIKPNSAIRNEIILQTPKKKYNTGQLTDLSSGSNDKNARIFIYEPKAKPTYHFYNHSNSLSFPDEKLSFQKEIYLNFLKDDEKYNKLLIKGQKYDKLLRDFKKMCKELNEIKLKYSHNPSCVDFNFKNYETPHTKNYVIFSQEKPKTIYQNSLNEKNDFTTKKSRSKDRNIIKKELIKPVSGSTKITNIRNTVKRKIIVSQIKKLKVPSTNILEEKKDMKIKTKYLRFSSDNKKIKRGRQNSDESFCFNKRDRSLERDLNTNNLYKKYILDETENLNIISPIKKTKKYKIQKTQSVNIKVKFCPKFKKLAVNEINDMFIIATKKNKVFDYDSMHSDRKISLQIKSKPKKIKNIRVKENEFQLISKKKKIKIKKKGKSIDRKNRFGSMGIINYNMSLMGERKNNCKSFDLENFGIDTYSLSIKKHKKFKAMRRNIYTVETFKKNQNDNIKTTPYHSDGEKEKETQNNNNIKVTPKSEKREKNKNIHNKKIIKKNSQLQKKHLIKKRIIMT